MVQVKKRGARLQNGKALEFINAINEGDYAILPKKMWVIVTPPGAHILRHFLKREFKVQSLSDDSGWKVTALS